MTPQALSALLAQAPLPPGLVLTAAPAEDRPDRLFPEERAAIARAVARRRADFVGGRVAARRALSALGLAPVAIPRAKDGCPIFPAGVAGSIAHAGGLCLALAGMAAQWDGLGIDIETDRPLDPDLVAEICRPEERPASAARALRVFSAKEAAYKAQYPATRVLYGFDGMIVSPQMDAVRFADTPATRAIPAAWRSRALPLDQRSLPGAILSLVAVAVAASG